MANSTQNARARKKTGWKTEKLQPAPENVQQHRIKNRLETEKLQLALVNVQLHRIKKQAGKSDLFFSFV